MNRFNPIFFLLVLAAPLSAGAVSIDIFYPDQATVRAALTGIDAIDDRIYTLTLDAGGTASIGFGDGIQGARPASGGPVVASYRFGTGLDGKIINEYDVTGNDLPFIPIEDFWPSGVQRPEASFILAGLKTIEFDFTLQGLQVISAEPLPAAVPLPAAAWLFASSLLGLIGFRQRNRTNLSRARRETFGEKESLPLTSRCFRGAD